MGMMLLAITAALALIPNTKAWAAGWVDSKCGFTVGCITNGADGKMWAAGGSAVAYWNGSSWVRISDCCFGVSYLTVDYTGKLWAGNSGGYLAYWSGSQWVSTSKWPYGSDYSLRFITAGHDGKIWALKALYYSSSSEYNGVYWNGSSWVDTGVIYNSGNAGSTALITGPDGRIWAAGREIPYVYAGCFLKYWNGSSWVSTDCGFKPNNLTTDVDGRIWVSGDGGSYDYGYLAYWDGSRWVSSVKHDNNHIDAITVGTDGKVWAIGVKGYYLKPCYWNGTEWVGMGDLFYGWPANSSLKTGNDGKIWALRPDGLVFYYDTNNTLSLIPARSGATGNLTIKPQVGDMPGILTNIEYSTDGSHYINLGPGTGTLTISNVTTSNIYVRAELKYLSSEGKSQTFYSNVVTVPTVTPPSSRVSSLTQIWDKTRGRGAITLTWNPVPNASGYRLWVFDGYNYRTKDLGNVTSWDSRTAKIFPFPSELPENNSVSTDIFRWDGSGLDLEDTGRRLYRTTIGTTYDGRDTYWFRVSAYNQWMETDYCANAATQVPTLPNATDTLAPTGAVSALSSEGLKKTYDSQITVQVSAQETGSGIRNIELSNDNVSFTRKYQAPLNPDNGTGITNYSNTFDWTVPLGAGTKTVYVRVTDAVGNQNVLTDSIALAEDMLPPSIQLQINNGADFTSTANVNLTISVQDNASVESQMLMRLSNDGSLWSAWEIYKQIKSWSLAVFGYGGSASPGIKKVYVQVHDQAQNTSMAVAEIGYNPSPPTGNISVVGGSSGTWEGKSALFSKSDSPALNLAFAGATQVRFDPGTGVWGDWEAYASQKTVYLVKSQGAVRLRVQVKDAYGVTGSLQEFILVVDPAPPVINTLQGLNKATATKTASISLEIVASDNLPGTLQYRYQVNNNPWSTYSNLTGTISVAGLTSGANRISVEVKDMAGNTTQKPITIFKV